MEKRGGKYGGKKIATLALLTGLGLIAFLIEALLPSLFLPGAKLGLSNVFSLFTLVLYGLPEALLVVIARTVLGSIFAGNLSLLLYSLTAGVVSVCVSRLLLLAFPHVSLLCVSVVSAVVHNMVQLLVYCGLTQTLLLMSYSPYLCLLGAVAGFVVGIAVIVTVKIVPLSVFGKVGGRITEKTNNGGFRSLKAKNGKLFFRGVHIRGRKELSAESPISPLHAGEVAIPMSQHIGAPAEPVVEIGQTVKRGQLIGKGAGYVSANVHASVAGVVKDVSKRADGRGGECTFVVIEASETQETDYLPPLTSPTKEAIVERVKEAGIVGMGGAGFPTHVKLSPASPVDTLVLNGAECEPYLTCDDRLMREQRDKIVRGAFYLAEALGVKQVLIGIEKNKPEAIALFEETDLQVIALKKQYPMGSEKHLIYCATGRKVPIGKLPADAGVVVQNVATAYAVCEAVEEGKPLIERVVTVSGDGVETPKNLLCPVGTPLSALTAECGVKETAVKYVAGGPMTGTALTGIDSVVTKTTSGFLFLTEKETNNQQPTPCINCGKCASVCPMKLMPMQIEFYAASGDYASAEKYGGALSCIGCGACGYICPARRPLAQAIKATKAELGRKKS